MLVLKTEIGLNEKLKFLQVNKKINILYSQNKSYLTYLYKFYIYQQNY